jgi:signal transduction histidine kinase/DNA-binding response OmpR family regulator
MKIDLDIIPFSIIKTDLAGNVNFLNTHIKNEPKFLEILGELNVMNFIIFGENKITDNIVNYPTFVFTKTSKIDIKINTLVLEKQVYIFIEDIFKQYEIKNNFMANFSHEVRNPLNSIIGIISLLHDTVLDTEQINYIDMLKDSSNNLMNIVDNILDYSKLENGSLKLKKSSFYLRECIETVHSMMSITANEKSIKMSFTISEQIPAFIVGDYIRIQQILINMYSNSIKFTKLKGSIVTDITGTFTENKYQLDFSIHDSGSPEYRIKKEDYQNIFKSYHQLFNNFNDRNNEGTGLGLAICKELVLIMNGDIQVVNSNENGTTITFYITIEKSYDNSGPIDFNVLKDKNVLIVDDTVINRVSLCSTLKKAGMIPYPVSTSEEALIILKNNMDFDIALLDIYLPRFSGVKLAEHIRILKPDLPLIALSSVGDKLGNISPDLFNHLLVKPVKENNLLSILQSVLLNKKSNQNIIIKTVDTKAKIKILIDDDDKFNRQVLKKQLEKLYNTEIVEVSNGKECIDILGLEDFDLIFIDLKTPIKTGYDVIKFILKNKVKVYTVCLSGFQIEDTHLFDDILIKPIEILKLKNIMNKYHISQKISKSI